MCIIMTAGQLNGLKQARARPARARPVGQQSVKSQLRSEGHGPAGRPCDSCSFKPVVAALME